MGAKKLNNTDIEKMIKLRREGLSYKKISIELKCAENTIWRKLTKLGL
jgi:DNA-binding CsgD family transcriptional regulator